MPKRQVVLNYSKCAPEFCTEGQCQAAQVCPKHLIRQVESFVIPDFMMTFCLGCGICTRVCPQQALEFAA